jgi:hypothetical protein
MSLNLSPKSVAPSAITFYLFFYKPSPWDSVSLDMLVMAMLFCHRYRIPYQHLDSYWFPINKLVDIIGNKYSASYSRVAPENVGLQKEQKYNTFVCHTCNEVRLCLGNSQKGSWQHEKIR